MKKIFAVAAMAAVVACHAQAASVVQSSATVSGLSYQLVDLTPGDQHASSFTWQEGSAGVAASVWRGNAYQADINGTVFDASSSHAELPEGLRGSASSTKSGNSLTGQVDVARSDLDSLTKQFFDPYRGTYIPDSISADAFDSSVWILAPQSEVTITGRVQLSSSVDAHSLVGHPLLQSDGTWKITASSYARFKLSVDSAFLYDPVSGEYTSYEGIENNLTEVGFQAFGIDGATRAGVLDLGLNSTALDDTFSITVRNPFAQQMRVSLSSLLSTNSTLTGGLIPTPAVPEPGTWALMALGLGAMAWRTRASRC